MEPAEQIEKIKIKEFYSIIKWVFSLYFSIVPFQTVLMMFFAIYAELDSIIYTFIFAKALDQLINVAQSPDATINSLIPYILVLLGYNIFSRIITSLDNYNNFSIRLISRPAVEEKFYTKLKNLGIQTLQQPEVNNKIIRSSNTVNNLTNFIRDLMDFIGSVVKLISSLLILLNILPILAPIFVLFAIPNFFVDKKFRRLSWKLDIDSTEARRKANSSLNDISGVHTLEEILITGSFKYLSNKYQTFSIWFKQESLKLRKQWISLSTSLRVLDNFVYFFGVIKIFENLLSKLITIGDVTFQIRILSVFQGSILEVTRRYNHLFEISLLIKDSYQLYTTEPAVADGNIELPKLTVGPQISINNVNFKYPGSDRYIFKNLNLNIKSGEKIAIVGHNGAGKTTLVRLICRMYGIKEGEILVNGTNLNELKIDTWYQNIGILFQDYNVYPQLSAKENIFLGRPLETIDENKIREASKSADAEAFIKDFKHGYEQILSERYKEGTRPSTGQWQKLAIARFFYRDAPLVIFDEPTSSIDAVSEYNIFNKIYKFFEKKTVIIISHRFSTVRNADRIIVIEKGKIIEEGTHQSLIQNNGLYAQAFQLQAEGYNP